MNSENLTSMQMFDITAKIGGRIWHTGVPARHPDELFVVSVSSRLNQFMVTEPRKGPGRDISV